VVLNVRVDRGHSARHSIHALVSNILFATSDGLSQLLGLHGRRSKLEAWAKVPLKHDDSLLWRFRLPHALDNTLPIYPGSEHTDVGFIFICHAQHFAR